MNKNSLKKAMSALAVAAVAASASSVAALAADYPDGQKTDLTNYGTAANATVKPVLTINVDGKSNEVVYDDAADIAGKTITCSLDVSGAAGKYASTGLHVFFDSRLELVPNAKGAVATKGAAIEDIMPSKPKADPTAPEGFSGFFVATAGEDDDGQDGTMWTFTFEVPADAKKGDVFPIDIIYRNESAEDIFINKAVDKTGCNMQAYTFVKGIYNTKYNPFVASEANVAKVAALANIDTGMDAYIAISDVASTTTTTTSSTPTTTTHTQTNLEIEKSETIVAVGSQWKINGNQTDLTYESSDKDVVVVSKSGIVTAKKAGTAFIFITNKNEDTTVLKVTVVPKLITAQKYGDANLDGNVSVADAVAIMQFLGNKDKYNLSEDARANADVYNTGDGLTGMDALTIQKVDARLLKAEDLPILLR